MPDIRIVAQWVFLTELFGLFTIVFWKLMTGSIPLSQLLDGDIRDPRSDTGYSSSPSPARIQTLLVTLFAGVYCLIQTLHNPRQFPEIPNTLLAVLAGSQSLYLAGKAKSLLLGRLRNLFK